MTLVNVNRFHCASTTNSSLAQSTVAYKSHHHSPTSRHRSHTHLHNELSHHALSDLSPSVNSSSTANSNNSIYAKKDHHHSHHQECQHRHNHHRRRSSAYDNSSDASSSFSSSCSSASTSSPALFADKSRLVRLKRNCDDQQNISGTQCKSSLGFSIRGGEFLTFFYLFHLSNLNFLQPTKSVFESLSASFSGAFSLFVRNLCTFFSCSFYFFIFLFACLFL